MFLHLKHTKLDVFFISKEFVLEAYQVTKNFPAEEKFALVSQTRRAAVSVHLNIAESCSRKSAFERKRFFEIVRGSVIEVDAALDIAFQLQYCIDQQLAALGEKLVKTFKLLCGMIGEAETHH